MRTMRSVVADTVGRIFVTYLTTASTWSGQVDHKRDYEIATEFNK